MASPVSAGDIVGELTRVETVKQTAAIINQGDLMQGTTTGFRQAPASANNFGPWAVCYKTTTASNTTCDAVLDGGEVYVVANGTIQAHQYVQSDSGTAGNVVVWAVRATNWTNDTAGIKLASQDYQRRCGIYLGHVDEGPGTVPTNAAASDIIRIKVLS